jgi:hypothetical protein
VASRYEIKPLAKRFSDSCYKIENSNRFLKEIIASTLKTSIPHMMKSAHRQDGDTVGVGIISNERNNFQTIHIGQTNFKQDYIGWLLLDFVNGTRPRMSNLGLKTGKLKLLTQRGRLFRLVVNQKNGLCSVCAHLGNFLAIRRSATSGFSKLPKRLRSADSEISNAVLAHRPFRRWSHAQRWLIAGRSLYGAAVQNDSGGISARTRLTRWSQTIGTNESADVTFPLGHLIHKACEKAPLFGYSP